MPSPDPKLPVRALIVAIEEYPKAQGGGMAKKLPGTLQAGLDFKGWLLEKWKAEGRAESNTQMIFCSEPAQPGGLGATAKDIRKALLALKQQGQSATDEFYFFFSGHGFSFVKTPSNRADIVIASDFEDPDLSGDCCLNLDEIISWLRIRLGQGRHFYFVDACRNRLSSENVQVGSLLRDDAPEASGEASTFLLQSTVDGAVAAVGGPFPAALLAGLRGRGKAKAWDPEVDDAMFVRYESLQRHLSAVLPDQISHKVAGSASLSGAVLATIRPIPLSKCTIEIENAPERPEGAFAFKRGRAAWDKPQPLTGRNMVVPLEPDDYTIRLSLGNATVEPTTSMAVDLYEDRKVIFKKGPELPAAFEIAKEEINEAKSTATLRMALPDRTVLELRNVNTGEQTPFSTSGKIIVPQGRYFATWRGDDNHIFKRQAIDLEAGKTIDVGMPDWRPPHVAIASKLPHGNGAVDFSEALKGAIADPDLDLWLALIGGGRILGPRGDYSKMAHLPLHDFSAELPGASPIYVLAGLQETRSVLRIGLSETAKPAWSASVQPPDMPGIREAYFATRPGQQLVSLHIEGQAPYTVASFASPNRATLITLTLDEDGSPRVSQYLLPLGHLLEAFPAEVRTRLVGRNHLSDVRYLAKASRAFRKRRNLLEAIPENELMDMLSLKWLDPIACSLAAYEYLRRGRKGEIGEAVANMNLFFAELPDTAALTKLTGVGDGRRRGVPLFFDGLRAFPDYAEWLPLPAGHLDYASPWTAWRAAVKS